MEHREQDWLSWDTVKCQVLISLKNFAPEVNDVTVRIALIRMMVKNLDSMLMDVETVLLYGELDEEIYVEVPVGLNEVYPNSINEEKTCFLLNNGNYQLCQAARQFWKKFVQEMSKLDFEIESS